MAQWEREEAARQKMERERQKAEREKIDREHYRMRLTEELQALRKKERETGASMDEEKVCGEREGGTTVEKEGLL